MVPCFGLGEEFFASLTELDAEMARQVAAAGCRWCGGPLHQANYHRKPRGGLFAVAGEAFTMRHSLCCGAEGCRRRTLPPSLRFLGRRVYLEVVVVLASLLRQLSALADACATTGVPGWTLRRWSAWWRGAFPRSRSWAELRARFRPPPPRETDLPRSLVARLDEDLRTRGIAPSLGEVCQFVARLLAPATTATVLDGSRFVRDLDRAIALG
jgi:hypothetical protein